MMAPYDTAVYDLATKMLDMVMTQQPTEGHRRDLATVIQESIDEYLDGIKEGTT